MTHSLGNIALHYLGSCVVQQEWDIGGEGECEWRISTSERKNGQKYVGLGWTWKGLGHVETVERDLRWDPGQNWKSLSLERGKAENLISPLETMNGFAMEASDMH